MRSRSPEPAAPESHEPWPCRPVSPCDGPTPGQVQTRERSPAIAAVELTQAVQHCRVDGQGLERAANSVPLIAGKRLFVRVYPDLDALEAAGTPAKALELRATVRVVDRNGKTRRFASPWVQGASITRGRRVRASLTAVVVGHACRDEVDLRITLSGRRPGGASGRLGRWEMTAGFTEVPAIPVHVVALTLDVRDWNLRGVPAKVVSPMPGEEIALFAHLSDRVPVPSIDVRQRTTPLGPFRTALANGLRDVYWYLVWTDSAGTLPYVTAAVIGREWYDHPMPGTVGLGGGGVIVAPAQKPEVAAHELGHVLGRGHAPCATADGTLGFPRYEGMPRGSIGEWGFRGAASGNGVKLRALRPERHWDDMVDGECTPTWVSSFGYRRALRAARHASWQRRPRITQRILVELEVLARDAARIGQAHVLGCAPRPPVTPPSEYTIELRDDRCGTLRRAPVHLLDSRFRDAPEFPRLALASIPWDDRATELVVRRGGRRIASEPVAPAGPPLDPPTVTPVGPSEVRVEWTPAPLPGTSHVVRYSNDDGVDWTAVAVRVDDAHVAIDLAGLPSGPRCLFEVTASRGLRSTTRRTPPFARPPAPLAAVIAWPLQRTAEPVALGAAEMIELIGAVLSPDEEPLRGAAMEWFVSDGLGGPPAPLGEGERLIIPATDLPDGISMIHLRAAAGSEDTITVTR